MLQNNFILWHINEVINTILKTTWIDGNIHINKREKNNYFLQIYFERKKRWFCVLFSRVKQVKKMCANKKHFLSKNLSNNIVIFFYMNIGWNMIGFSSNFSFNHSWRRKKRLRKVADFHFSIFFYFPPYGWHNRLLIDFFYKLICLDLENNLMANPSI